MLHEVKKAKYLEGYRIRLLFDNGITKVVDLEDFLKNAKYMLAPLKELNYFKQVKCDGTTICWPNGVDLCPDVLYSMGKKIELPPTKRRKNTRTFKARKKSKLKTSY